MVRMLLSALRVGPILPSPLCNFRSGSVDIMAATIAHTAGPAAERGAESVLAAAAAATFAAPPSAPASGMVIRRLAPPPGSEVDFGAEVLGVDASRLSDDEFAAIRVAVYTHHVVVLRGQGHLSPPAQLALTRRFDPTVEAYGHGHDAKLMAASVLQQDLTSLPAAPQVSTGHARGSASLSNEVCSA
jgi:hypothetical protein